MQREQQDFAGGAFFEPPFFAVVPESEKRVFTCFAGVADPESWAAMTSKANGANNKIKAITHRNNRGHFKPFMTDFLSGNKHSHR